MSDQPNPTNLTVHDFEIQQLRELDDFDLVMLLSEIHEHGWYVARHLLTAMHGTRRLEADNPPPPDS